MKRILLIGIPLLLLLAIALFYLRGCNEPQIVLPWGLWKEIRKDARQSPDYLRAQYEHLRQEGTPQQAFEFVRDKVTTVPAQSIPGFRWGIPGILRTGQGTPFEKALLLSSMLEALGIDNEIHWGRERFSASDTARLSQAALSFQSQLDVEDLNELLEENNVEFWSRARRMNTDSLRPAWRDSLTNYVQSIDRTRYTNWNKSGTAFPVYALVDSTWVYLNPSYRDAAWGEHFVDGNPDIYRFSRENLKDPVRIRIKASYDDKSYSPFTLAEANWPLDSIIGKDIRLGFKILGPPDIILNARPHDFETFVSSIELLDTIPRDDFRITGDILTTHGNVVSIDAGRSLLDEELDFAENEPGKAHSIKLSPPRMADYPTVMVEAEVLDSAGNPVMGLSEEDFEFMTNDKKVTHRMIINQHVPPRILFLFDDSGSMPFPYITREKTIEIFKAMAEACHEVNPDTEFAVSPLGDKERKIHELSRWSNDIPALTRYIRQTKSGESNNWSALLGAMNVDEANMVVVLSDADGSERGNAYTDQKFKESLSTFVIGVPGRKTIPGEFEKMAAKTQGRYYVMDEDLQKALEDISREVGETKNDRYLIELEMEAMDIPEMDLSMGIPAADLIESLKNIDIPPPSSRRPLGKSAITGLYLEMEYQGNTYHKKLAGVPLYMNERSYPVTEALIEECNNALWGEYILHIEGSSVLPSVAMDQVTSHYLALEKLVGLLNEEDPETFFEKIKKINWTPDFPGKWSVSMNSANQGLYEQGLNVWVYSRYPDREGAFREQLDRVPSSNVYITSGDRRLIAKRQMETSLNVIQTARLTYGKKTTSGTSFQHRILNGNGRLSGARELAIWQEPAYTMLVNKGRKLIADPDNEVAFVQSYHGGNLTALTRKGTIADNEMQAAFEPDKPLVESPYLWRKMISMEMDTWDDLEGNKLAYIQAGTVAMKNLGEGRSPEELMKIVKKHLVDYMRSEMRYPDLYFSETDQEWMDLYNLCRNNLMALPVNSQDKE